MTNPDPFDALLDQIADLISLTQKKKGEPLVGEVDEDTKQQLDLLEQQLEIFRKITDEAIKSSGINEEALEKAIQTPPSDFAKKQQRVLERTRKIKAELVNLEQEYDLRGKFQKIHIKKNKTAGAKRKKKFKRLGGQGWTPI